MFSLNYICRI